MPTVSILDLRRIAEAVRTLKGRSVTDATVRSDFRQLRVELGDGLILLVSAVSDDSGRPRLDVDVVKATEDAGGRQLEVRFEAGAGGS